MVEVIMAPSGAFDLFDGIDRGQAGDGSAVFFHLADDAVDDLVVHERPDSIVHQDYVLRRSLKMSQRVGYRLLAMFTALHNRDFTGQVLFRQLAVELFHLTRPESHDNLSNRGVPGKHPQGVNDDGNTLYLKELLRRGCFLAGARPTAAQYRGGHSGRSPPSSSSVPALSQN